MTNQWVNSYKRLVRGGEAPTAATWGRSNRSALVRVPKYTPNKSSSRRVEIRSPDSACNPYLTFAVLLAAGLRGVEKGYSLMPAAEEDVASLTVAERRAMGFRDLPGSLADALNAMERSELVAEALGEHVFDFFLRNKRREWEEYRSHVTPFELREYLDLWIVDARLDWEHGSASHRASGRSRGRPARSGRPDGERRPGRAPAGATSTTCRCCGRCPVPPTPTSRCAP